MKASVTLLLAGSLLLCACEKEVDETRKPLTPSTANLMGKYKITKVMGKQNGSAPVNITESYFPDLCERDDVYGFNNENIYDRTDAGVTCNPPTTITGNWQLLNPTTLVINGEQATIHAWNGKNLELTIDYGGGVQVMFHYIRQ